MSFFNNLLGGGGGDDKDKKKKGVMKNPFANLSLPGQQQRSFQGTGQSLGGSVSPGTLIPIELKNPGTLGLKIEKRTSGVGTSIVSMVVEASQAEKAGLQRGDIICYAGSEGKLEIRYDDFLAMAASEHRPLVFDVLRIQTKAAKNSAGAAGAGEATSGISNKNMNRQQSADAYARQQAVIAAAEARDKAHKAKQRPLKAADKKKMPVILSNAEKRQQELERERDAQLKSQEVPRSEATRKAMEDAKASEAVLTSQLGYNPYEASKSTAGQARNATSTVQHGAVGSNATSGGRGGSRPSDRASPSSLPAVAPPREIASANDTDNGNNDNTNNNIAEADTMVLSQVPEFDEAYTTMVTSNSNEAVIKAFGIIRTLVKNATTKGQQQENDSEESDAAKFRRVRLANAKIKAAVVDVSGALELLMSFGFQLVEEDGESYLVFPLGSTGPDFLPAALRQMERYEKS